MDATGYVLMAIVFGVPLLFLVSRLFWLWYWKIPEVIALLESIDESLKQLPAVQRAAFAQAERRRAS